ncbi:MAG: hypothetical protein GX119_10955 [Syntrophomonadaceae bacterium]|jgi:formylmethanofuran dehydrogenase subunit E|nr:hypothetical protein [Syntrophomonadaceae bacterium]
MATTIARNKISSYEKQVMKEKSQELSYTRCRVCHEIIGNRKHVVFEERYFHIECLKQNRPVNH